MNINQIRLQISTVKAFYKKNLITDKKVNVAGKTSPTKDLLYLGNNGKNVAIIVSDIDSVYLPDQELNFLTGILNACKLTLNDAAIINIKKNPAADYLSFQQALESSVVLMFDVSPPDIGLPLTFPQYQIQKYNDQVYLTAPKLSAIEKDKGEKTKLWITLRQIFHIV